MDTPLTLPAEAPSPSKPHLVDRLLLDSQQLSHEIAQDRADPRLLPRLLVVVAGGMAAYGLSVGLQGGLLQAAVAAVKLPVILLVSAGLTLPILHLLCAMAGQRLRMDQLSTLVLQSLATASVAMAGLAPLLVVGWLTLTAGCSSCGLDMDWWVYRRMFLLGLAIASAGGLLGAVRLLRTVPLRAAAPWSLALALAGLQLSWLLRPVVGMPGHFVLLRPLESNALTEVLTALWAVLT